MPTYDYVCDACGHAFEHFQSITADPEKTCPECGRRKLRRLIGTGAAILVGGRSAPPEAEASSSGTTESTGSESSGDTAGSDKSQGDSTDKTSPKEAPTKEKKISGSTSTPTHEAREGRGVGNLVDAVRRQRKAGSKDSRKSSKAPAGKASKKTSGKSGKAGTSGRKGSGGSKPKK